MKNEYTKLKEICDKIGIKNNYFGKDGYLHGIDVREIIFTQEFMDKIKEYVGHKDGLDEIWFELLHNLNEPVDYLYNLIFNEMSE